MTAPNTIRLPRTNAISGTKVIKQTIKTSAVMNAPKTIKIARTNTISGTKVIKR